MTSFLNNLLKSKHSKKDKIVPKIQMKETKTKTKNLKQVERGEYINTLGKYTQMSSIKVQGRTTDLSPVSLFMPHT